GLLNCTVFSGDFAEKREAGAERRRAFELLTRHFRIHDGSGVDGGVHAADFYFSVRADFHLNDGGYVSQEAAMQSEAHAKAAAVFLFAPARFFGGDFHNVSEPRDIDRIGGVVAVVIRIVLGEFLFRDFAIRAEQR